MSGPGDKVEGEQWSDERIKGFLEREPRDDTNPDFYVLIEAYQFMTPEFFARFVAFFADTGRDINATSPDGERVLDRIAQHPRSGAYVEALKQHGAELSA